MRRFFPLVAVGGCLLAGALRTHVVLAQSASDLVALDLVVTDKDGQFISDLRQDEVQIEDDGKKMELKSFKPVNLTDGRSVIVVLDDAGIPPLGTQAIQNIADIFMSSAGPGDKVALIRVHNAADTLVPDRQAAGARIMSYQAGAEPFDQTNTPEDLLKLTVKLSQHLQEQAPHARKAILCIGAPVICNIEARASSAPRQMYPNWVSAVDAMADANTSFYSMIPAKGNVMKGSITDTTGGETFTASGDFAVASREIWRDLSQYYLAEYAPNASTKDLRKIAVKVSRKGAIVQARTVRGK